jgi:hypothetical protein
MTSTTGRALGAALNEPKGAPSSTWSGPAPVPTVQREAVGVRPAASLRASVPRVCARVDCDNPLDTWPSPPLWGAEHCRPLCAMRDEFEAAA